MAAGTRSRARRAAPGGAGRDRHAGDVRARRRGDRQPGRRDVRGVRLVRDAAAGRLRAGRCATGCRRRRRSRSRAACSSCVGHAGLAHRRGWPPSRWRSSAFARAVRRRRQLGAGRRDDLAAAGVHPAGLAARARRPRSRIGWPAGALASAAALLAIALLWPAPARDPVRGAAIAALPGARGAAARRGRPPARRRRQPSDGEHDAAIARADAAVEALHAVFFATPYRPTGLSTAARAVVRLVDELTLAQRDRRPGGAAAARRPRSTARRVRGEGRRGRRCSSAARSCWTRPSGARDGAARGARRSCARGSSELERGATCAARRRRATTATSISSLDPSFRAQELSFVGLADRRRTSTWPRPPSGAAGSSSCSAASRAGSPAPLSAAQERAGAHVERHSVWLHNSVRGAVGLGLAVLVANLTGVQHSFWVVLGTLSVLRSNALSTGQNVAARPARHRRRLRRRRRCSSCSIGTNTTLLWVLLPLAVLLAGLAPAAISFAAGQAAFTRHAADPLQHPRARGLAGRAACASRTSRSAAP